VLNVVRAFSMGEGSGFYSCNNYFYDVVQG